MTEACASDAVIYRVIDLRIISESIARDEKLSSFRRWEEIEIHNFTS